MNCLRGHTCWQSKRFYWDRAPGWRAGVWGNPGERLCPRLTVLGCSVMGLVSGSSLANPSDSESFLVVHALSSQDGCQRGGFWEVVRQVVSPFGLSWTLPVDGGLLLPCSLPGPPVIKQLMQMVTVVPGQGGRFSPCASPDTHTSEGLMLKLKFQCFGRLMRTATLWKCPWCWERLWAEGEEGVRGRVGWMASPVQWTWPWANSGRCEGQGDLVCCRLRSCRVRHDWATEQQLKF